MLKVFEELLSTNSPLLKVSILKKYDCHQLRKVLVAAYHPYKVYGIGKASLEHRMGLCMIDAWPTEAEYRLLDDLANRKLTGHAAIRAFDSCNRLLDFIATKDLRCGISVGLIEQAFPKLIPKFKIQRAKEVPYDKHKYPMNGELKYNGCRLLAIVHSEQDITFKTSSGKLVPLPRLKEVFKNAAPGVYDGELISLSGSKHDRQSVTGMINSAMRGGNIVETNLRFAIFDYLTLSSWVLQRCSLPWIERRKSLQANIIPLEVYGYAHVVESVSVNSAEEAQNLYQTKIAEGYEGLILKRPDHKYRFTRTTDWIKLKETRTADLECINYMEGSGKYEGMIGSLICEGVVEGKAVTVSVGSGLSDADRSKPGEDYMYSIVEIKYNEVIPDKSGTGWTLFLPRFNIVRIDK